MARGHTVAAAQDHLNDLAFQFQPTPRVRRILRARYDLRRPSFNSGVLSICPGSLSGQALPEILELHSRYFPLARLTVQPIRNLYFHERWERLSPFANLPFHVHFPWGGRAAARLSQGNAMDGAILHLWGQNKPWRPDSVFHAEWARLRRDAEGMDFRSPLPFRERPRRLRLMSLAPRALVLLRRAHGVERVARAARRRLSRRVSVR